MIIFKAMGSTYVDYFTDTNYTGWRVSIYDDSVHFYVTWIVDGSILVPPEFTTRNRS